MKKIFFICFLISIICSGCSSSRLTKSEYDTFNDYAKKRTSQKGCRNEPAAFESFILTFAV